jgi:hypothetical protein
VWAVAAPAAGGKNLKVVKPLGGQIVDKLLEKHKNLTFDQFKSTTVTDPEWQQMIATDKLPARPEWTKEFVAPTRKK